ncbi:MAG: hypothetical protein WCV81_05270 [Microgenomates group bacterium]|jgi:hypothetical protein
MRKHVFFAFRILVFLLILPLLGVAFAPPVKINAACDTATGSQIQVSGGLISAISVSNFSASSSADVSCVTGAPAAIPQFSIPTYDDPNDPNNMIKNYFNQAKSTYNKKTLQGDQTQNSASDPINLISY